MELRKGLKAGSWGPWSRQRGSGPGFATYNWQTPAKEGGCKQGSPLRLHSWLGGGTPICFGCRPLGQSSQRRESARVGWVASLPQAELISLARVHSANPLPVSRGAKRPPGLGREWVVREAVLPSRRLWLLVCRKRPEFQLEETRGSGAWPFPASAAGQSWYSLLSALPSRGLPAVVPASRGKPG